jgi:hypothetical protein
MGLFHIEGSAKIVEVTYNNFQVLSVYIMLNLVH